jgi:hypothetical protein
MLALNFLTHYCLKLKYDSDNKVKKSRLLPHNFKKVRKHSNSCYYFFPRIFSNCRQCRLCSKHNQLLKFTVFCVTDLQLNSIYIIFKIREKNNFIFLRSKKMREGRWHEIFVRLENCSQQTIIVLDSQIPIKIE